MAGIVRKPGRRRNKEPQHNSRYPDGALNRIEHRDDLPSKTG
jgi:hypothetical protein